MTNQIITGDCLEEMGKIPDGSVSLILTDPPYSTPVVVAFGRKKVKRLSDLSIQEFYVEKLRDEFARVLKPDGRVVIFCDDKYYPVLFAAFYHWHQVSLLVWDKGRIGMGTPFRRQHELMVYAARDSYSPHGTMPTVIRCPPVSSSGKNHGAEKPVELLSGIVRHLTEPDDLVLDPFAGSGSTLVAAKTLGRRWLGIEMDGGYAITALKRLNSET